MTRPTWSSTSASSATSTSTRPSATLREDWGGALCVSRAERTETELIAIQNEISADAQSIRTTGSSVNDLTAIVEISVVFDDGRLQASYDDRYGPGIVHVNSCLQPL